MIEDCYTNLGLLPPQVYELTPNEIQCLMNGYVKKTKQQTEERMKYNYHLAWHTAAFVGSMFGGELPDLKKLMAEKLYDNGEPTNETLEELKIVQTFKILQDRMGSDLIQISDLKEDT